MIAASSLSCRRTSKPLVVIKKNNSMRVAVIGAGPSGLAALRAFRSAVNKSQNDDSFDKLQIVCFEKQGDWGGIWNYTDMTGLDEYGEPIHTSMYRHLFSNGPKECLEFADYTFDEHFGKPIPSFPPRIVLWDYIQARADKAGVRGCCRFRSPVRMVTYDEKTSAFHVTVHDLVQDRVYTETFDYVIVASGHFSTPNLPLFDGWETFPGVYMHSRDYRRAERYKGQDLLVVGGSYSAEDIALQCWKYGAKSVVVSYRSEEMDFDWPDGVEERPLVTKIEGSRVSFKDGSSKDFDTIILCTGFLHSFPFLSDDLRLKTTNRMWVPKLYNGVVWEDNPRLFYLGMQDQYYTFNMFDAQAWYARDVILGRIQLPTKEVMTQEEKEWLEKEDGLEEDSDYIWFQGDYVKKLISETDCPYLDTDGVNKAFEEWISHKDADILTYRDKAFKSLVTGTMACTHPVPWVDMQDDSLQAYIEAASSAKMSQDANSTDENENSV